MEIKKNFTEIMHDIALLLGILGIIAIIIVSIINLLFFNNQCQALNTSLAISLLVLLFPAIMLNFGMSSGILKKFNHEASKFGKLALYLGLFPIVSILFIIGLDYLFHFLPNYQLITNDMEIIILPKMRELWLNSLLKFAGIFYLNIMFAGFIFKQIFSKKD